MFYTESKLQARIAELSEYRYRDTIPIPELDFMLDETGEIGMYPPAEQAGSAIKVGDVWKGRDLYAWLSANVTVPRSWEGRKVLGRFDFGYTDGWNNSGFESLLFLNGNPYQGVDANHKEVFLPDDTIGQNLYLVFRLWSGLEGGGKRRDQEHKIKQAEIVWLDEETDDLFFTTWAMLDTVKVMDANQPERALLLRALDKVFIQIDWSRPGSEIFYASIRSARDLLTNELAKIDKHSPVTITCIGHTHIDVAWLWQLKHTREKCARSFSTVLRLMEMYPEYIFMQTQPQLYAYMKEDYPEIYEKICEKIKEGRWEAAGGMWLEADCNLTSGESLVRQLLIGTRFLRNEFGVECNYLWLPDVFGYSWALPQILQKSGISTFMTTKISWNQYNRMPYDTFQWRGIDGTEVLTHFITTPEPGSKPDTWFYTYNGKLVAETVKGTWDAYRNKSVNQELLLSYGYGDGGGGVNREMLELRRRLDRMPGLPSVKMGTADAFFARLQKTVSETTEYVHTWDGELYLEYHRGTYTSQAYNKRMNRKLELLYRETEWLSVLASVNDSWSTYKQSELNEGWKIILRNQFHDIIPGSSIREVYEDSLVEYTEAAHIGTNVWRDAVNILMDSDDSSSADKQEAVEKTFTVLNSGTWPSNDLVEIKETFNMEKGIWRDSKGGRLNAQHTGSSWIVEMNKVPSLGYSTITFTPESNALSEDVGSFKVYPNGIITPFYEIQWNALGQLISVYDREHKREVLASGARGNVFQVFEDKPLNHEAWDIDLFYQEKMKEVMDLVSVCVVEKGVLRAVVRLEWAFMDSVIRQDMVVYANCRRIDFQTEIDWHERQQLLKVAFPVDIRATEATYDIQFGNVKRPTHWNTSWDYARFETVGHQWADLSDRGYGVSLLNDCKYGYDIKDNLIRLSLIKSAIYPDTEADQGLHVFTYSLLPHLGDWLQGDTAREAWSLNNPLSYRKGKTSKPELSLFRVSSKNVIVDAVKKAEDDDKIIVRVHDYSGSRSQVDLSSDLPITSWQECDLMERPIGVALYESIVTFVTQPYEIRTFIIALEG
ncbi:alpha-mannosidase [Paenibacillus pectinilyticus]|uniref:Alpha-mannosidase n=1 Tax=Paenibacillus pectinilyticus TaxID=512399 RepID=A0A1C1A3C6_9BACL|nr:alpha-mannosidase [Paenibacillus pectinilyticus]OCT15053.1 alpha-mannosidase [Paenibacillus pectinilyticus]